MQTLMDYSFTTQRVVFGTLNRSIPSKDTESLFSHKASAVSNHSTSENQKVCFSSNGSILRLSVVLSVGYIFPFPISVRWGNY